MRFQVFRRSGHWRWRLVAVNGRVVAESGSYRNRADCVSGVEIVKNLSTATPVEDLTEDTAVETCAPQRLGIAR